jgi:hypothetical protein
MQYELLVDAQRAALQNDRFVSYYPALQILELALQLEHKGSTPDYQVNTALKLLREAIPKTLGLDEDDINRIGVALNQLPDKYAMSRDTIRTLLVVRPPEFGRISPPPALPPSEDWGAVANETAPTDASSE